MYLFQAKIPKSSYFKRASLFGFYYYYMGIFCAVQILSTLGYLTGNIACRTGSAITSEIIEISITFGSCESIILSYVLVFLRFKLNTFNQTSCPENEVKKNLQFQEAVFCGCRRRRR